MDDAGGLLGATHHRKTRHKKRETPSKGRVGGQCMRVSVQTFSNATNVSISHAIIYVLADKRSDLVQI